MTELDDSGFDVWAAGPEASAEGAGRGGAGVITSRV